jgi:hypothetical protein
VLSGSRGGRGRPDVMIMPTRGHRSAHIVIDDVHEERGGDDLGHRRQRLLIIIVPSSSTLREVVKHVPFKHSRSGG